MGDFAVVRPQDDGDAQQASDWCDELVRALAHKGHTSVGDVDGSSPATAANILTLLGKGADIVLYLGHGDENSWLTSGVPTITALNISAANSTTIVSVACKTGCNLAPAAITAGVTSFLAFTINVPIMAVHKNVDPIGEAIVDGLATLGGQASMQTARDAIASNLDNLIADFEPGGKYANPRPRGQMGYYAAMSLRDHIVLHGSTSHQPLP